MNEATNNPEVLKTILRELIEMDFDGDTEMAAEAISIQGLGKLIEKRSYKPLTKHMLNNILSDKSQIKFSQLELICGYLQVPVGVLLLFTRIRSSKRDNNFADIEYLKSVCSMLSEAFSSEDLSIDLLKEIGSGSKQLTLDI